MQGELKGAISIFWIVCLELEFWMGIRNKFQQDPPFTLKEGSGMFGPCFFPGIGGFIMVCLTNCVYLQISKWAHLAEWTLPFLQLDWELTCSWNPCFSQETCHGVPGDTAYLGRSCFRTSVPAGHAVALSGLSWCPGGTAEELEGTDSHGILVPFGTACGGSVLPQLPLSSLGKKDSKC